MDLGEQALDGIEGEGEQISGAGRSPAPRLHGEEDERGEQHPEEKRVFPKSHRLHHPCPRLLPRARPPGAALGGDRDFLEEIQLVENLAGAESDAGQRVVSHGDGQVRFLSKQEV